MPWLELKLVPFKEATVVVIDAIGEWETITLWHVRYDEQMKAQYKKLYSHIP